MMTIVQGNQKTSHFDASTKIKCMIEMALNKEISWSTVHSTVEKLTPTFEKSKQVNKLLLHELEKLQSNRNDQNTTIDKLSKEDSQEEDHQSIENLQSRVVDQDLEKDIILAVKSITSDETSDFVDEEVHIAENQTILEGIEVGSNENELQHLDIGSDEEVDTYGREENGNQGIKALDISGEKAFTCKECGKKFKRKHILKSHEYIHTGEKPYKCKCCDKAFNRKSCLKRHEKIHGGDKPFLCHICSKRFLTKYNLSLHMIMHTEEKPFPCKICKKSFSRKPELKLHNRVHSGEKPYKCQICDKKFFRPQFNEIT